MVHLVLKYKGYGQPLNIRLDVQASSIIHIFVIKKVTQKIVIKFDLIHTKIFIFFLIYNISHNVYATLINTREKIMI